MTCHQVVLHSDKELENYFYSSPILYFIEQLKNVLPRQSAIHLFPEATLKSNKVPNGLLLNSLKNETLLMPALLRDPGCGFLLFKLFSVDKKKLKYLSQSLIEFCEILEDRKLEHKQLLEEVMVHGVSHLHVTTSKFANDKFSVLLDYLFIDLSLDELCKDLSQITNSLEIKIPMEEQNSASSKVDLLGFIHTGSEYLPKVILEQWFQRAVGYTYGNNIANIEQINMGLYGFNDNSEEALEYQQCIYAAMNYCIYKRWLLFSELKKYLYHTHHIEIDMVSDRCHAGLFNNNINGSSYIIQTRGVQLAEKSGNNVFLMAGHKESVSYLFQGLKTNYIGHGTSYAVDIKFNYEESLPYELKYDLSSIMANTTLNSNNILPYNYNIEQQRKHLEGMYSTCTTLYPVFNYQGRYLRAVNL
ncbi:RtcB family protein [Legionella spiritensis]|uniref:RtcB family protein n=1 Tax=Legionella spiritensis TaxID=452 RepID=UPI000F6FE49A|nr:RtcB family protein [Legionella spiritensis]VEG91180.1 Uncharacterized protein family UPF0027 [Legionella spiritensis]